MLIGTAGSEQAAQKQPNLPPGPSLSSGVSDGTGQGQKRPASNGPVLLHQGKKQCVAPDGALPRPPVRASSSLSVSEQLLLNA